uniref:Uncharacterized protein n=1 Tax=Anguilla anguilla TaxID=7936 RepID=A0A0E9PMH0_ANGAN
MSLVHTGLKSHIHSKQFGLHR